MFSIVFDCSRPILGIFIRQQRHRPSPLLAIGRHGGGAVLILVLQLRSWTGARLTGPGATRPATRPGARMPRISIRDAFKGNTTLWLLPHRSHHYQRRAAVLRVQLVRRTQSATASLAEVRRLNSTPARRSMSNAAGRPEQDPGAGHGAVLSKRRSSGIYAYAVARSRQ